MEYIIELCFTIAYVIIMVVALTGNTLLIYIVWKIKETRVTTSFLFVNMAVADLLVTIFQMPVSIVHFYVYEMSDWVGHLTCGFIYYVLYVSTTASIFCLAVMAFDRYFAVVHPMTQDIWFRKSKIIAPIVWISSMALMSVAPIAFKSINGKCSFTDAAMPYLPFWTYLLLINYLVPLAIISILYTIVARTLWFQQMPGHLTSRDEQRRLILKKKVVRTLVIVVVVFAICWGPMHVFTMDAAIKMAATWHPVLIYFCYWLSQANSAINPWLYIGLNSKMKAAFTNMIRCRREGNMRQGTTHGSTGRTMDTKL